MGQLEKIMSMSKKHLTSWCLDLANSLAQANKEIAALSFRLTLVENDVDTLSAQPGNDDAADSLRLSADKVGVAIDCNGFPYAG